MNVPVLVIRLHGRRVGLLFQYDQVGSPPIIRFVADDSCASAPFDQSNVLSESFRAASPAQQKSFWVDYTNEEFNAKQGKNGDWQLPAFFQNLLPEGVFRRHVAEDASIDPKDHIRMLAACGKNLPGAVTAEWEDIPRSQLQTLITQNQDALEMSVWSEPYQEALSMSGVQPKIGVSLADDGRFVGRTSENDVHIIAKLPTADYTRMPQVEDLCMRMARACKVDVCDFDLLPMSRLAAPHRYDLGDEVQGHFLAVYRFDRVHVSGTTVRFHFEDFAQVMSILPEDKYKESYLDIAYTLMDLPGCGQGAVLELLRRIEVNALLGNADMHLKNIGLLYKDPRQAELAPAYDITSTILYNHARGHALKLMPTPSKPLANKVDILTPHSTQVFCENLGINPKSGQQVVRETVVLAAESWLDLILRSDITRKQKHQIIGHFLGTSHAQGLFKQKKYTALGQAWEAAEVATA